MIGLADPSTARREALVHDEVIPCAVKGEGDPLPMPPRPVLPVRVTFLRSRQLIPVDLHTCLPGPGDALHLEQRPERWQQVVVLHAVVPQQGLLQGLGERLPDGLFGRGNLRAIRRRAKSGKRTWRIPDKPSLYTGPRLGYRRSHPGIMPVQCAAERKDSRSVRSTITTSSELTCLNLLATERAHLAPHPHPQS